MSMKPALGVMRTRPAIAPIKVLSRLQTPDSRYVMSAHVIAPAEAQIFVTQAAITLLKFSESVVPASKASQEFQIMTKASS